MVIKIVVISIDINRKIGNKFLFYDMQKFVALVLRLFHPSADLPAELALVGVCTGPFFGLRNGLGGGDIWLASQSQTVFIEIKQQMLTKGNSLCLSFLYDFPEEMCTVACSTLLSMRCMHAK